MKKKDIYYCNVDVKIDNSRSKKKDLSKIPIQSTWCVLSKESDEKFNINCIDLKKRIIRNLLGKTKVKAFDFEKLHILNIDIITELGQTNY